MTSSRIIEIKSEDEVKLIKSLEKRDDFEAKRIKRYLDMPDLSRTPGSPIAELSERITSLRRFKYFDIVKIPEIVPADMSFDLFNFPPDHPARSKSDTYFIDDSNILRTHTTVMWYYWLNQKDIRSKIKKGEGCKNSSPLN